MEIETALYITSFYSNLFTEKEKKAWRHWSCEFKLTGYDDTKAREVRRSFYYKTGWMTYDQGVLALLAGGIDQFYITVAKRITVECEGEFFLKNCPKCQKLTRSPKAKQCRYCYHAWH